MRVMAAWIPALPANAARVRKTWCWQIAKALAARINAEPGMKAVLTRDGDYFISLRERNTRARRAKADLFVSIHADAIANPDVSGSSVYVLSDRGASSEAARWLAERENAADLKGGIKLDDKDADARRTCCWICRRPRASPPAWWRRRTC